MEAATAERQEIDGADVEDAGAIEERVARTRAPSPDAGKYVVLFAVVDAPGEDEPYPDADALAYTRCGKYEGTEEEAKKAALAEHEFLGQALKDGRHVYLMGIPARSWRPKRVTYDVPPPVIKV